MSVPGNFTLPETAEGNVLRQYLEAQHNKDFSDASKIFTEDVVYNDVMFPEFGLEKVAASLQDYVTNYLLTYRVEAVTQTSGSDTFLVLYWMTLKGIDRDIPVAELVAFRDGKIHRVDNCFDRSHFKKSA